MAKGKKVQQPIDPAVQVIELEKRLRAAEDAIARLNGIAEMIGAFPVRVQMIRTGHIVTVGSAADFPKDGSWRLMECGVKGDGSLR